MVICVMIKKVLRCADASKYEQSVVETTKERKKS